MYLTILILPILGSFLATNRNCGNKFGPIISVCSLGLAVICCICIFLEVGLSSAPVYISLGNWINFGNLFIKWSFLFDTLTVSMYLPIIIISFLVQKYSLEYMNHDPHKSRFFSLLSLFSFTMLILVTGDNLLKILLGWELVGLVSYLLVNFWYTRIDANKASKSALFLNKIGDLFFMLALVFSIGIFSDLSLTTIFSLIFNLNGDLIFILAITLIIAGSAKSALIPLNAWLKKAMEGPTPVSALLHSSTMVTAGVFLLIKISPILELSSTSLMIITWLGSLGALFGAAAGLVANDVKRIVAFSTASQLGYKVVAIGISQYNIALFHLFTHAFFKSLLFLASGAILHAVLDSQDIRKMGSLNLFLPFTYLVFLFGSLSLMAFPFTSGWYSKDLIIELLIVPTNFTHTIAYIFTLLGAFLTSSYSIRVKKKVMLNRPNFPKTILNYVVDSNYLMTLPLLLISIGAITFGYLSHELFLAYGSTFYLNSIFIHPATLTTTLDAQFGGSLFALLPLLFLFFITILFFITPKSSTYKINYFDNLNNIEELKNPKLIDLKTTINQINFTNILNSFNHNDTTNYWIMHRYLLLSNILYRYIDRGILELFGPIGGSKFLQFLGFLIELLSTGFIPHYALMKILSLFVPILMIYFFNFNINLFLILIIINFKI